jgi:hypothetical protein
MRLAIFADQSITIARPITNQVLHKFIEVATIPWQNRSRHGKSRTCDKISCYCEIRYCLCNYSHTNFSIVNIYETLQICNSSLTHGTPHISSTTNGTIHNWSQIPHSYNTGNKNFNRFINTHFKQHTVVPWYATDLDMAWQLSCPQYNYTCFTSYKFLWNVLVTL